jgi:hypothetical protein
MLDSTGSWNKQKTLVKMKGYPSLRAIDKCIVVTPNIKVHMLENIYEMVRESDIMYAIEIWGLNGAWKEVDKVHSIFCTKIIGIPNCAANGFAEKGLGRESRKSKCLGQIVKYWYRIMFLETEQPIKQCYERQKYNMGVKSWAMGVKEELHNIGLTFVWRKQQECNWKEILRLVKERCNDIIERQNILAKFLEKSSLTLYRELNFSWGKKIYIECCSRKERGGIAWLIAGIWQLKGARRNTDKGRWPLCLEEEDAKHILLECKEIKYWREKLIHDKWLNMNKEITYRKILKTTNRTHVQNVGKYLDIVKNKWFNKIKDNVIK